MIQNKKLNGYEKQWLEKLLSTNFAQKKIILSQINQADIERQYTEYYLSIKFVGIQTAKERLQYTGVPLEMRVFFKNEVPIQFLLHVGNGVVRELEVFKADSSEISCNISLDDAYVEVLVDPAWE